MIKKLSLEAIIGLLAGLYSYAAYIKIVDHLIFKTQLSRSPVLASATHFLVWATPMLEILLAILLTAKWTRLIGFYGSIVLLLLFTTYLIGMYFFSPTLPCSCGGFIEKLTFSQHIFLNIFLLALSIGRIWLVKYANNVRDTTNDNTEVQNIAF